MIVAIAKVFCISTVNVKSLKAIFFIYFIATIGPNCLVGQLIHVKPLMKHKIGRTTLFSAYFC